MLLTYGRGRAEQFRLHPTAGSILNFVPPLFCVYLAALALFGLLGFSIGFLPLIAYPLALVMQSVLSARDHGIIKSFLALPLVVLAHIFYGLGFWGGLFTRLEVAADKPRVEVTLERIT